MSEDITKNDPDVQPSEVTDDRVGLEAEPDKDELTPGTDEYEANDATDA